MAVGVPLFAPPQLSLGFSILESMLLTVLFFVGALREQWDDYNGGECVRDVFSVYCLTLGLLGLSPDGFG